MSHSILSTFLDEFEIRAPENYFQLPDRDKRYFFSRLENIARLEEKRVVHGRPASPGCEKEPSLKEHPGLKMHFQVSRKSDKSWNNIPNETFARKLAFFAEKTIITFPFHEVDFASETDLHALLTLLCTARPYIEKDMVSIFPSSDKAGARDIKRFRTAHDLVPANFEPGDLEEQLEETVRPIAYLLMPTFNNIAPGDVIRIRQEESILYSRFENNLSGILTGSTNLDNEKELLHQLQVIDEGVRKLTEKFEAIREAARRKDVYTLLGFVTVALVVLCPPAIELAQIIGAGGAQFSVLKWYDEKMKEMASKRTLREEEFYLLWRMKDPRNKIV